jgi:phytol kinase
MALGSVGVLLGLMAIIRKAAKTNNISAELQRKLVHIGTGIYALTLPWLFPERWPVYMLVCITLVIMLILRLPRFSKTGLGSTLHSVDRKSYGDMLLAVAVGLCLFFAQDQLYLYVLPIAVLTLADAAAALAGTAYGSRFFRVEDGLKSLEGCVVFFGVTLLLSMVCLLVLTPLPPVNIILLSLMVAGFGTLVEAVSWRGFDNLFLPLGLLVFLASHAQREVADLVFLAVLFAATLIGFRAVSPMIGLTNHAGRVYVTTVFLVLAVTSFHNAMLPISVFLAHAWSRASAPGESAFPDLDIVAGVVLVSLFWLTLGNATEWNAVSFYGMTTMGMSFGFCALAVSGLPVASRLLGLFAVGSILSGLRYISLEFNDEIRNWNGPMWQAVMVNLTVIAALTMQLPTLFMRYRVAKLIIVSSTVPLAVYCFQTQLGGLL